MPTKAASASASESDIGAEFLIPTVINTVFDKFKIKYCFIHGQIGRELRWGIHYGKGYVGGTGREGEAYGRGRKKEVELKVDQSEEQTRTE